MAQTVLLVSEQKLKAFTAINENVQATELAPFISQAQDIYLQSTIGTKFFDALKSRVLAGTLTVGDKDLLDDYIAPMLMNFALYMALPFLKYKVNDKGILSGSSETATQTTLEELQYLRQSVDSTAQFYRERLREHLLQNPSLYPDYVVFLNQGMSPDRQNGYFSGLVIPKRYAAKYHQPYCPDDCDWVYPIY